MPVALRAHHLLCMLTYSGKGYSEAFVRTFDAIVQRLRAGEPIELVAGPDEVCAPLAGDARAHCHCAGVGVRDRLAAQALAPWFAQTQALAPGAGLTLPAERLGQLRAAFARGEIRAACAGCEWDGLCTGIAHSGFKGVLLRRESPAPA